MKMESSRKWMILVATTWVQAFTGTNFNFSSYSTEFKSVLGISQAQLNYISVASDMGKIFGWCCGVSLLYLPIWFVLFLAASMGFVGYGLQWMAIQRIVVFPYSTVLFLSLLAGCSICWFNTVCYVLCINNFSANNSRQLSLSLTISFNGVSGAMYNLIARSIDPNDNKLHLLLNSVIPFTISIFVFYLLIDRSPYKTALRREATTRHDYANFKLITTFAVITGSYLLISSFITSRSHDAFIACLVLSGAISLLVLPLVTPRLIYLYENALKHGVKESSLSDSEGVHEELMAINDGSNYTNEFSDSDYSCYEDSCDSVIFGQEHSVRSLVHKRDFWLYYVAYLCSGTLGLVYSNNLGQISQSLGCEGDITSLVSLFSAFSFFGRLLSATPDYLQNQKLYYPRTGCFTIALVPSSIAFFMLVLSGNRATLVAATGLIGLGSGFVFSAAVSITSELFGPKRAGINHNILITNIPIGSLLYSILAAKGYEINTGNYHRNIVLKDEATTVCFGRDCYRATFGLWWIVSLLGVACGSLLFLRTKGTYYSLVKEKHRNQSYVSD